MFHRTFNKLARVSGILLDHAYIKKALMEVFLNNVTVENIYCSDHDVVRILIGKKTVDYHNIH